MAYRTTVEQVAYDMRKEEIIKLLRKCSEEDRDDLMYEVGFVFCRQCWKEFTSNEVCYCTRDE